MPKIEQRMRNDIAKFLPNAMKIAIQSYLSFCEEQATDPEKPLTTKEFRDHHDACKVAIAHIELLIKLAIWADIPPPELEDHKAQATLQMMIEQADKNA